MKKQLSSEPITLNQLFQKFSDLRGKTGTLFLTAPVVFLVFLLKLVSILLGFSIPFSVDPDESEQNIQMTRLCTRFGAFWSISIRIYGR